MTKPEQAKPHPKEPDRNVKRPEIEQDLEKSLEDTFPASDPPSMTQPGHGAHGGQHRARDRRK